MESMEEFIISSYMTIDEKINDLKRRIDYKHWAFYQQSFHTSIAYTGYEIVSQAVRADKALEYLDEAIASIKQRIEKLEVKRHYWYKFLATLKPTEREYFHKKYILGHVLLNEHLDNLAIEEIEEINGAIALRYCTTEEYEPKIELIENDYMSNIDRILEAVGA